MKQIIIGLDGRKQSYPIQYSDGRKIADPVVQIWDDLHNERAGFFRAFWTENKDSTSGSPVFGYAETINGSHKRINSVAYEVWKYYPDARIFRNGKELKRIQRNPLRDDIQRAKRLADDFSGHIPNRISRVPVPKRSPVRLTVGQVTGIMYLARRDGRLEQYLHRFAKGSRPQLVASPDGKLLELLGGAFSFTERGIVDKTPSRLRKSKR